MKKYPTESFAKLLLFTLVIGLLVGIVLSLIIFNLKY